jgi:hypothetical protein
MKTGYYNSIFHGRLSRDKRLPAKGAGQAESGPPLA